MLPILGRGDCPETRINCIMSNNLWVDIMKWQKSKPQNTRGLKTVIKSIGNVLASGLNCLTPKRKYIAFCSFPDFSDNARAVYECIQNNDDIRDFDEYTIIWHVQNPEKSREINEYYGFNRLPVRFVKKGSASSILSFFESEYVVSTHGLYNMIGLSGKQTSFLLWHGMPIKKIGFLYDNDVKHGVQQADYYFVTSKFYQKVYQDIFHAPEDHTIITGQPRNDFMFADRIDIKSSFGLNNEKIIMYLPTYRVSNNTNKDNGSDLNANGLIFGGTYQEWKELNNILANSKSIIVVKPHPAEKKANYSQISSPSNVYIIDEKWLDEHCVTLYDVLGKCDKLITDYSSVYIDYLLLDRPICFFIPDYNEYEGGRGFIMENPSDFLPGMIIQNFSELREFIKAEDTYQGERARINDIFNDLKEPEASKNVLTFISKMLRSRF